MVSNTLATFGPDAEGVLDVTRSQGGKLKKTAPSPCPLITSSPRHFVIPYTFVHRAATAAGAWLPVAVRRPASANRCPHAGSSSRRRGAGGRGNASPGG